MNKELHQSSIAQLQRMLRNKEVSAIELTEHYLARIKRLDGALRSFPILTEEIARTQATVADREITHGMFRSNLHGIPFALKDVYDVAGVRTTGGSRKLIDNIAVDDSTVARRFLDAGAIFLGKNMTWEFTHGQPASTDIFSAARNPWNNDNDADGSSTGSAAAVGASLVPISMGSDTGGSIRDPAAVCGVVGFKPTYGLVSRRGVLPNCFSHDTCGPITWGVEDSAIVMDVIAGFDPLCPGSANVASTQYLSILGGPLHSHRIGVPRHWFEKEAPASAEMRSAFDESLRVLRSLGVRIIDVELPLLREYNDAKKIIAMVELFSIHAQTLRESPELLGESLRYLISCGAFIRAETYIQASRWRRKLAAAMSQVFETVDFIVTPTVAKPAGKFVALPLSAFLADTGSYTTPFNVSGFPAITIRNGFSELGMPLALQIAGRAFDDARVMQIAHAYELASGWAASRPAQG